MKVFISLLTLSVLSVQFLYTNSNPCRWINDGLDCVIHCLEGGSSSSISGYVQSVYDELTDCHSAGVKLILPQDVTGYTLRSNWLQVDINLIELEMDAARISEFDGNVFAFPVFANVKKLKLKNFRLLLSWEYDIRKSIFIGLESLDDLMITDSAVKIFDNGWLDNINGTIKSLLLTGMGEESSLIVEKLTGGNALILSNVEYVKIQYNLSNPINYRSFTAIPNVRVLDLSGCSISVIEEFSFEKLGSKLQLLNLERNRLKTLPSDIFNNLYLSSGVTVSATKQLHEELDVQNLTIRLSDNLWHCDCTMNHLKDLLIANTNFAGDILCTTPEEIINYPINRTEFCPLPITTDMTTETSTVPIDDGTDNERVCSSYNDTQSAITISIQPQMQRIRLNRTSEGVSVTLDKHSNELILIWLKSEKFTNSTTEYQQNANSADCFANFSNTIRINDLEKDTSYTFCLMNISQRTVSPFDCISYYNPGKEEIFNAVWLYESSKPLTLALIVIACVSNVIIGVIIGAMFLKFSIRLAFQCWKNPQREAINSKFIDDFKNRLHPSFYTSNSEMAPPLPPHPLRDFNDDDVYYASVK